MYKKSKLSTAIIAVLAGYTGISLVNAAEIEEVVVTATKRAESAQDIPVAVQALGGESIEDLNVTSFDDYVKYLPNISRGGRGPGQNEVYIRGQASDAINLVTAESQGSAPNVALYLDEQPVTSGGRNLDIYITDMERVEVLAGPQGTLFGASSQAGTVRLITNKPRLSEFEAGYDVSASSTQGGDMSNSVEAYINIPLIEDKLAVRIAAYNDNKGGYIDNVYGTTTLDIDTVNSNVAAGFPVQIAPDAKLETADNLDLIEDNFNDATYQGVRFGVKYAVNEDWDLLVQHTTQTLSADGVFDYDPAIGDLKVSRFFRDELVDKLNLTSWTLSGRLAELEMLYTGGYVDREVSQSIDYTGYNNVGGYIAIYTCGYSYTTNPFVGTATDCYNPVKAFVNDIQNKRQTHEFRINTSPDNPLRLTAGIYYDYAEVETDGSFTYLGAIGVQNSDNPTYATRIRDVPADAGNATLINPNPRLPGEIFNNDMTRSEEQLAVFGELSYDITDKITATAGLRYYNLDVEMDGWSGGGFGGNNLDEKYDTLSAHDFIPKFTLSYALTEDILLYSTYSEGYRPAGYNRGGGLPASNPALNDVPVTFQSDDVQNIEFGWKTTLLDGSLQFNGTIYHVDWTSIQIPRFDPSEVAVTTFVDNGLDAEILGLEADVIYAATDNLTLFAAISYNDTEVVSVLEGTNFDKLLAPVGSPLPLTPKVQGNVRARYEWQTNDFDAYWQLGIAYADSTYSALLLDDRLPQESYTLGDLTVGVSRDQWTVEFFVENITDKRAQLHFNNQDRVPRITTNRPRTFGLRYSYDF